MAQISEYADAQKAAISAVNDTLKSVGLPTYTALEQNLYATLVAAHESIETGKVLLKRLGEVENRLKRK